MCTNRLHIDMLNVVKCVYIKSPKLLNHVGNIELYGIAVPRLAQSFCFRFGRKLWEPFK